MKKLRRGQIIMIDDKKYVVNYMVEFKNKLVKWYEYEIARYIDSNNGINYEELCVLIIKLDEFGKFEYFLCSEEEINNNKNEFDDIIKNYEISERGTARVKSYFGVPYLHYVTKYSVNSNCHYQEYASKNGEEKIFSKMMYPNNDKTTTYTRGKRIKECQIRIRDEFDKRCLKIKLSKQGRLAFFLCVIGMTLYIVLYYTINSFKLHRF